jgi:hypothetical protein
VKYMKRTDWLKTPFAGSRASNPDGDIGKLFLKHRVIRWAVVTGLTDDGRPRFGVQFFVGEVAYRIAYDCLDAPCASEAERLTQVKRAVLHRLKTTLDEATVFAPLAELLLPYAVGPTGRTVYETVGEDVRALRAPDLGRLMLGPKT